MPMVKKSPLQAACIETVQQSVKNRILLNTRSWREITVKNGPNKNSTSNAFTNKNKKIPSNNT